jgi:hypothetical protein
VPIPCRLFALSRREFAALLAAFVLSLPAVTARIYSSDEIEYFSYLRSVWFDHDVSFDNEYRYFYDRDVARAEGFHETFLENETEAGRRPNFGTIGCALLWSPFYAAGDVTARVLRVAGRNVQVDGFSRPYIAAVAYGSAVYGFLAVLLSIGAARRLLSPVRSDVSSEEGSPDLKVGPATDAGSPDLTASAKATASPPTLHRRRRVGRTTLAAGVLVWIGTPLLFYMYVAPPMSHACSAFAVALFVTVWLHVRRTWTTAQVIALGLAAALMAMVREQDVFFAIGPALDFAVAQATGARDRMRAIAAGAAGCVAFAIGFLPQLVAYVRLNGHAGPSRLVMRKMTWTAPHALEVVLSPAHGFFFWTPLALVAVAGLIVLAVRQKGDVRRVALIALLMVALQVYVGGSVESWNVAGAFGQRRFVALTILLVIGLAALRDTARGVVWRSALVTVTVLCVWWNLALIALFGTGLMDRKQIELGRNVYDAFVTIPRTAPQLAYRYLVNRESYYRSAPPRVP